MGRLKTKLELIASDKKRKSCFDMRSKSIMKKADELSKLCGINVGLIISSSSGQITNIHTWPNNDKHLLDDMIRSYTSQDSGQRKKRTTNVAHFLGRGTAPECDGMSVRELRDLAISLDGKARKVKDRIEFLKQATPVSQLPYLQAVDHDDNEPDQGSSSSKQHDPMLFDIHDDGNCADLAFLLDQILENPMTPTTTTTTATTADSHHDDEFGIAWSNGLPLLVNPKPTTTSSSSSTDHHHRMNDGDQLLITDHQLHMT